LSRRSAIEEQVRRLFDVSTAVGLIVVSAPIWLPIVVLAAAAGKRPILYAQERVGHGGALFQCWKFRTMRVDADEALDHLLANDAEARRQWAQDRKLDNDPRVTRFGRFLRRFDLDELPQLLNVIGGEMSLVGPRPVVPDETIRFGIDLETVLSVRPGLTGAWQTSGRNLMTYEDRVRTEVDYVRTRSLGGDIKICARTVRVLIRSNSGR
jgi:lipopolysaccharide/colanic/teichoic acid biosynthesis glycosyltransferase